MDDICRVVVEWYEKKMDHKLYSYQIEIIQKMLKHGLTANELMDCIDKTHVTCGMMAFATDYWRKFHAECRALYRRKNKLCAE